MELASRRIRLRLLAAVAVPVGLLAAGMPGAADSDGTSGPSRLMPRMTANGAAHVEGGAEIQTAIQQYAAVRTAPAASVSSDAYVAAAAQKAALPSVGGPWAELTDRPFNSDAKNYRDPFWSNSGAGFGNVAGRMPALATDGNTLYAGGADGGVWKSTDKGRTWTALFQQVERIPVGALAINPVDSSVWVGTGEANTAFENYSGVGVFRSGDGGATWQLVGNRLQNSLVSEITFDGKGMVYVSTSRGLLSRSLSDMGSAWTVELKPDPNPTNSPYRGSFFTDVKVRPGTGGNEVIAPLGWRGGTLPEDIAYNGWYVSTNGGGSWKQVVPQGIAFPRNLGRTTFSYSANGKKLYAVVESPGPAGPLDAPFEQATLLKGAYRSDSGTLAGPWVEIADSLKLTRSGSALARSGGTPGQQAWYNQYIAVDPKDDAHVYLGLEEVFETSNSGSTWSTIGPYWNFPLPCYANDPDSCPQTTHADQHSIAFAADGTVYMGNDGGVYSRPTSLRKVVRWNNHNATLYTLQYYYGAIGKTGNGDAIWGGLQDNGVSLLRPGGGPQVSPQGGDGGDVIVDPNNADRAVVEYVFNIMTKTTNGGRSDGSKRVFTEIGPSCSSIEYTPDPCDPAPRFIAPFEADLKNINHWVTGGAYIWDNRGKGWDTECSATMCDWKKVHETAGQTTALGVSGKTIYAGWCGGGCNPGGTVPFTSGIDTNYGGRWHTVSSPVLPNRLPTSLTIDPANAAHVYLTYGAFSRRWIPGGGVGHVFESTNGGTSWTDISGNLPDIPANDVALFKGKLVVGTDVGAFVASAADPTSWSVYGANLPNTSVNDLALSPDGDYLVAVTHGRGLWRMND